MSTLQQQRRVVEQLRRESQIKRVNVSIAIEDLKVRQLCVDLILKYQSFYTLYQTIL
jgi:hypothetical protein